MTEKTAQRIARAVERIANRLDALAMETEPESEPLTCLHPLEQRMPLGQTDGWSCLICEYTHPPSGPAMTTPDPQSSSAGQP